MVSKRASCQGRFFCVNRENPIREAFFRFFGGAYNGRSSWDEVAVLYGVRGLEGGFREISSGSGSLRNGYSWNLVAGYRTLVGPTISDPELQTLINELMTRAPTGPLPEGPSVSLTESSILVDLRDGPVSLSATIREPEGGEVISWSIIEGSGTLSATEGDSVSFTHSGVGTYKVEASIDTASSATAVITVVDKFAYSIKVNYGYDMDIRGKALRSFSSDQKGRYLRDVSSMPSGMYVISAVIRDHTAERRLIGSISRISVRGRR